MSDSSDDDVPIAELLRRKEAAKEKSSKSPVMKTESKSNKPVVVTKKRSSSAVIEQKKDGSDSDDDVPIAELLRRKTEKEKTKLSKPPQKIAKTDPISTSSKKSTYKNGSASRSVNFSNEFYSDTLKGKLVQKLLVRWWYAMSWPNESSFKDVPQGFEPLNGFPGVFVSTRTDSLGSILDKRDQSTCPCLQNFFFKPSSELKRLCIQAIQEQIRQLVEAEGSDTLLERNLKVELREVNQINADKADREASTKYRSIAQPF